MNVPAGEFLEGGVGWGFGQEERYLALASELQILLRCKPRLSLQVSVFYGDFIGVVGEWCGARRVVDIGSVVADSADDGAFLRVLVLQSEI